MNDYNLLSQSQRDEIWNRLDIERLNSFVSTAISGESTKLGSSGRIYSIDPVPRIPSALLRNEIITVVDDSHLGLLVKIERLLRLYRTISVSPEVSELVLQVLVSVAKNEVATDFAISEAQIERGTEYVEIRLKYHTFVENAAYSKSEWYVQQSKLALLKSICGDYEECVRVLTGMLAVSHELPKTLLWRMKAHLNAGNYIAARADFEFSLHLLRC
jgi:hypothetical protein